MTRRPDSPPGPYGRWDVELDSVNQTRLTPVARASAAAAYQQFSIPGHIHDDLRPEILTVTTEAVTLQFQWRQNPVRFAITRKLPRTADDLCSPADSPQAWASYTAMDWCEDLSTGWTRWGRGRRRNGVIQLGRRTTVPPEGPYGFGGRRQFTPDGDGLIRVPHGLNPAMNTIAEYRAEEFISCTYEVRAPDEHHRHSLYVAQAVTVWTADRSAASLEIVDALPEVPDSSIRRVVLHAIHDAADAGAYKVVTTLTAPVLTEMGFLNQAHGQRALDVLGMS